MYKRNIYNIILLYLIMKKNDMKFTTISIPTQLVEKIKKKISGTGIHSPSAYVTFILRQILSETKDSDSKEIFSKEEETAIKKRLSSLGYK